MPELQVKLLRVLQTREFSRIGESERRVFLGKMLVATHRDLDAGLVEGWFCEDFYYRLCADRIQTPKLRERLEADPNELRILVGALSDRIAGPEHGAALARDVLAWVDRELDRYAALVYRETASYVEAGRRLGLDRRTVKERAERGERALADEGRGSLHAAGGLVSG